MVVRPLRDHIEDGDEGAGAVVALGAGGAASAYDPQAQLLGLGAGRVIELLGQRRRTGVVLSQRVRFPSQRGQGAHGKAVALLVTDIARHQGPPHGFQIFPSGQRLQPGAQAAGGLGQPAVEACLPGRTPFRERFRQRFRQPVEQPLVQRGQQGVDLAARGHLQRRRLAPALGQPGDMIQVHVAHPGGERDAVAVAVQRVASQPLAQGAEGLAEVVAGTRQGMVGPQEVRGGVAIKSRVEFRGKGEKEQPGMKIHALVQTSPSAADARRAYQPEVDGAVGALQYLLSQR